jgi:hypothetical protein
MVLFLAVFLIYNRQNAALPQNLWLEAESFGPLKGANFSFMPEDKQTRGSWSIAGPDTAPSWTQGGESEFMSIAARADEGKEITVSRETEFPAAGTYTLWVRYADYRNKKEAFGIRVRQENTFFDHVFGLRAVVDELDPMKLYWDWAFAWDSVKIPVAKGKARIEIYTAGVTEARRCVDCLCFTTDTSYHPYFRTKPDFAACRTLRTMEWGGMPLVAPLAANIATTTVPRVWKIDGGSPAFLWNVGQPWLDELKKPMGERVDAPFSVDPPLLKDFLDKFKGKKPSIYSHPLSGPVIHIPLYPGLFTKGSVFLDWLDRNPNQKFAILLNYGDPAWPKGADRAAVYATLKQYKDRFAGFIAGENIAYDSVDTATMEAKIKTAKSRREVLQILHEFHTAATVKKFSDYYGGPLTAAEAWGPVISCLSASNEAFAHALCEWGVRQIGHENTGNSPNLARRLAFLRGACRQFGAKLVDYQSCNFGDSATMFSRESFFFPASSRYVLDNSYDAWAGAGVNWLLKDYLLWYLAGVSAFYNEQGVDLYWKPGGGAAGDSFPVQLSPKGKTAEAVINLVSKHPRGAQFTPIAFLVDEAHGYTQERFEYGAFGLNCQLNPPVLTPGRHEASLRGWFDTAYYSNFGLQLETNSPFRMCYVNGIFGDIFDVIVNAPGRMGILDTYPVVIVAGEVELTSEWGKALQVYVRNGGTLLVCADQFSGPGIKELPLPTFGESSEASSFTCPWNVPEPSVKSNTFRYLGVSVEKGQELATAPDGKPLAVTTQLGKGKIISVAVPLGLGIDEQPIPLLGLLLQRLVAGQIPIHVSGDVEWVVNRLDDGGWLIALLNNMGVLKPAHGILPTLLQEEKTVTIKVPFALKQSEEWMTETPLTWGSDGKGASLSIKVPAGAVRLVYIQPG